MALRAEIRRRTEEHLATDRPDNLPSLLGVLSSLVDPLDALWISEDLQGVREVDAVLGEVGVSLRLVPLEHRTPYGIPVLRVKRRSIGHPTPEGERAFPPKR